MLETSHERVRLLKIGIDGKTIEKLYIISNNFKIVRTSLLFELVEILLPEAELPGHLMTPKTTEVALTTPCPIHSKAAGYNDKINTDEA